MLTPFISPSLLQQNGNSGTSPGLQKLLNRWQMPGGTKAGTPSLLQSQPISGQWIPPGGQPQQGGGGGKRPVMTARTASALSPQGPANNAAPLPGLEFPPATGFGSNPTGGYGSQPFQPPSITASGNDPIAGQTGNISGSTGVNPVSGGIAGTQLQAGFTVNPTTGQLMPVGGRFGGSGSESPGYGGVSSSVNAPYSGGGGYGSWGGGGGGYRSWADAIDMGY